jgi:hypothetical protein
MTQIDPVDFRKALRSVRTVRRLLALLLALSLLAAVVVFVLVDMVDILESNSKAGKTLLWVLEASKVLGVVLGLLLILNGVFAALLSLVGQQGAPGGFIGAFHWGLILLALLIPWQGVLAPTFACGATFDLGELLTAQADVKGGGIDWGEDWFDVALYYGRFLAYPILALFVLFVSGLKFGSGFRPLKAQPSVTPAPSPAPMSISEMGSET